MNLNGDHLIRLSPTEGKAAYMGGFWRWVEVLSEGDYQGAVEALYWPHGTSWTPETLEARIATFWGGDRPWSVVVPNDRLIGVVDDRADYRAGWFMAQLPLTTEPARSKDDDVPLMGLACSFFVRQFQGYPVMEFELFHA